MINNPFKRAERTKTKLRMAITGTAGSGKTYSALRLATGLGGKIALIDTEGASSQLYSDNFEFDTIDFQPPYSVDRFIQLIDAATKYGYSTVIVDSLSAAWNGEGGILGKVDAITNASSSKNSFQAWGKVNPDCNSLVSAIVRPKADVIWCLRSKTAYEIIEDEKGKKRPVKMGLAPIQKDGLEYEFDIVFDIDCATHYASIGSKNRTSLFKDGNPFIITETIGKQLREWLDKGVERKEEQPTQVAHTIQKESPQPEFVSDPLLSEKIIQTINGIKTVEELTKFYNFVLSGALKKGTDKILRLECGRRKAEIESSNKNEESPVIAYAKSALKQLQALDEDSKMVAEAFNATVVDITK